MTTAVVVTSIVTTHVGEAKCVDQVLEQVRRNDRDLRQQIAALDGEAKVVTAILNVNDFVTYAQDWLHQRQATPTVAPARAQPAKRTKAKPRPATTRPTKVVSEPMDEATFMAYTLDQLRHGQGPTFATLSPDALDELEAEAIGAEFSEQPFLY